MKHTVTFTKLAQKQVKKAPLQVKSKLKDWVDDVEFSGLAKTRFLKGIHDEPLTGKRKGQRSIRLNKQWCLIYTEDQQTGECTVLVLELNAHDYRIR